MYQITMLHKAIADFILEYQSNPFNFLFERDLQSLLFATAYKRFTKVKIRMRGGYHGLEAYGGKDYIETIPIKCEYPTSRIFDIAMIDAELVEGYDPAVWQRHNWKNDRFWDQRVRAAIELKYLQLGDANSRKAVDVSIDVNKLTDYRKESPRRRFLGISLTCIQSAKLDARPFCVGEPLMSQRYMPQTGIYRYVVTPTATMRFEA